MKRTTSRAAAAGLVLALGLVGPGCHIFDEDFPERLPILHAAAEPGPLLAGAGVAVITPPDPADVEMAGYSIFRDSTGLHDDLEARSLVLVEGGLAIVIVSADLIGIQRGDIPEILEAIEKACPVLSVARPGQRPGTRDPSASDPPATPAFVFIHCTHDHAGPDTLGLWGTPPFWSGQDDAIMARVREGMADAVRQAVASLQPAEVGWGRAVLDPTEIAKNLRHPGLVDPGLPVLHVRQAGGGETIATLAEYGVHAEVCGRDNTLITADFPRWMRARVEEALGGTCVYTSGALGGLVTPQHEPGADDWDEVQRIGGAIGDAAVAAVQAIERYEPQPNLEVATWEVALPVENTLYLWGHVLGLFNRAMHDGHVLTEVSVVRVGGLTIACAPGEITPDLGLAIERALPGEVPMILGLANDELGYLLPADEFETPLYDYERTLSVCPQAGEIVRRHIEVLCDLLAAGAPAATAAPDASPGAAEEEAPPPAAGPAGP